MATNDEHLWDERGTEASTEALERKFEVWERRDWMKWLTKHLSFPFTARREEDMDDEYYEEDAPFQVGHTMQILGFAMDEEDDLDGVIVNAREKGRRGDVPLADLEVTPKTDKNYWPVREYVVWFANR